MRKKFFKTKGKYCISLILRSLIDIEVAPPHKYTLTHIYIYIYIYMHIEILNTYIIIVERSITSQYLYVCIFRL